MAAILHTPDFLAFYCPLVHKSNHHCSTSRHTATALRNVTSSAFQKNIFIFFNSQNQSDVPPNLLEARKCVLWKVNYPHLSFFVGSFKLVTTVTVMWQWSCWFSDWNLCNLHNRVQVIQSYIVGHGDDDTNTDNDERALVLLDVICDDSRRQRATSSCLPSVQNPVTITMMVLIVIFRPISNSKICSCFCQAQRSRWWHSLDMFLQYILKFFVTTANHNITRICRKQLLILTLSKILLWHISHLAICQLKSRLPIFKI